MFIAALCTTAKVGKDSRSCRLMDDKENRVLTQEHHSALKENKILPFATTRMVLEVSTLSEISQTQGEEYCATSLTCGTSPEVECAEMESKTNAINGPEAGMGGNREMQARGPGVADLQFEQV